MAEISAARCVSTIVMNTRLKLVTTADTAGLARSQFFTDPLEYQDVRVDPDADRQDNAGDARQRQDGLEVGQGAEEQDEVQYHRTAALTPDSR